MKRKLMYHNVEAARIYKSAYRPSSNLSFFVQFLFAVIVKGTSPINNSSGYYERIGK